MWINTSKHKWIIHNHRSAYTQKYKRNAQLLVSVAGYGGTVDYLLKKNYYIRNITASYTHNTYISRKCG